MNRNAKQSNDGITSTGSSTKAHGAQFIGVRDSRNRRVPGLYVRNGRYYAQLWVSREDGAKTARKFPLLTPDGVAVANLAEAKEAADVLRNDRRENVLPTSGHKPKFADYIETYFAKPNVAAKKPGTLQNERQALNRWKAHLGDMRIDRIEASDIAALRDKRLRGGAHARTVNLDIIALRNVLKAAVEDEYLRELPKAKTLKAPKADKRPLLTPSQFAALLAAVPVACEKNAAQFADYLRFLAYTGAREQEALKVGWDDVDMAGERVTIGTGGVSKNHEARSVEFNDKLGALLGKQRRALFAGDRQHKHAALRRRRGGALERPARARFAQVGGAVGERQQLCAAARDLPATAGHEVIYAADDRRAAERLARNR